MRQYGSARDLTDLEKDKLAAGDHVAREAVVSREVIRQGTGSALTATDSMGEEAVGRTDTAATGSKSAV